MTADHAGTRSLRCSFCGREQTRVQKLIAGPDGNVCDSCVSLAIQVARTSQPSTGRDNILRSCSEGRCSFCGKDAGTAARQVPTLVKPDGSATQICTECLELCHEILAEELRA
jgi:ATP-dependent protease Clp ATPase subunit